MNDLLIEKRRESSSAAFRARDRYAARGPYLDGDILTVPSPGVNEGFKAKMKKYGFTFPRSALPCWERDVRLPWRGRVWSAEAWLELAWKVFNEFWGEGK